MQRITHKVDGILVSKMESVKAIKIVMKQRKLLNNREEVLRAFDNAVREVRERAKANDKQYRR